MEFQLTAEQVGLQQSVRRLLAARAAPRSAFTEEAPAQARALWAALNDVGLGALGLDLPQYELTSTAIEQMLVAEELGRAVAPVPFTGVAAATSLLSRGTERAAAHLLEQVIEGRITVAALPAATGAGVDVKAAAGDEGWTVDGEVAIVPGGAWAQTLLVVAHTTSGTPAVLAVELDAPGVTTTPLPAIDPTVGLAQVGFSRTPGVPVLVRDADEAISAASALATLLVAAESTGVAERALRIAAEYALTRRQFGHPIGAFQAIKHKLADMLVLVENARSACYGAAWQLSAGAEADLYVAMAKAVASESATQVAADALQIHGGIGCTFEHDIHLYLRRAKSGQLLYGDTAEHLDVIAAALLDEPIPGGATR
ncbi:acyl-CoA dehydrogenase family protein [Amycolatopsis thermophila]|uniref:Alkylation response protein AidB-like acyl-CoA dehydrogenase n=1 Tax=Amycolatopsis thermophila TaxID=206084 RepID=A0ABU0F5H1_9PSEU|nr:acyl-CoA dehydrogenase family protein [Amycolatopsis thermophila]MDQ0382835.1 alkylation response protein AidB-like acyl-CoA dehydrogenase [Amycolatopsis thermophila]